MNGTLFIISAPSGAGKTTILKSIYEQLKDDYFLEKVVTYTSKAPRKGEENGRDYHFVSVAEFEALLKDGFFLEHSKAYKDYYGSPSSIKTGLEKGISYLLIVDRVGAQEIARQIPSTILFWIEAPSLAILEERLRGRGTDTEETICRRLARAQVEVALEEKDPIYTHHLINDSLLETISHMKILIMPHLLPKQPEKIQKGALGGDLLNRPAGGAIGALSGAQRETKAEKRQKS